MWSKSIETEACTIISKCLSGWGELIDFNLSSTALAVIWYDYPNTFLQVHDFKCHSSEAEVGVSFSVSPIYMRVCARARVCVCVCAQSLSLIKIWYMINFWAKFNKLEFRVFLLLESSYHTKEPSLSDYSTIAGGRVVGFIPFPKIPAACNIQTATFRIWIQVTDSILHANNHYTTSIRIDW